ncbi:MAG: hypothetical protein IPO12_06240 [Flavobacteriales bacterium]|nr:hypothetical protein [Flavobacteriales bacterium]
MVRSSAVGKVAIDAAKDLKFIARVGSGLENIDVEHSRRRNILVLNSPEGNRDGVGETCVMLTLELMKVLVRANAQVRAGLWRREENRAPTSMERPSGSSAMAKWVAPSPKAARFRGESARA